MKELLFSVHVLLQQPCEVQGQDCKVVMLPFTGRAFGEYFNGEVIGTGVDTQKFPNGAWGSFSARYMLQGTDKTGTDCKVFIENNLRDAEGWVPTIVTDSVFLSKWEKVPLAATVEGAEGGVLVKIYEK
ncbi:MAG: hypothetical protein IK125_08205 [Lachnospiraceae bacterium]|nr:hypothetical protein [Lachnospiraceae bacterium]